MKGKIFFIALIKHVLVFLGFNSFICKLFFSDQVINIMLINRLRMISMQITDNEMAKEVCYNCLNNR